MREENQRCLSAVLISADGKILMGKNRPIPRVVYKKTWVIPGGIQDEGEEDLETLKREVLEETGINVSRNKGMEIVVAGDKDNVVRQDKNGERTLCNLEFFTYKVFLPNNSEDYHLSDTKELVNLTWFKPEELQNLEHNEPSKKLFKKMGIVGF